MELWPTYGHVYIGSGPQKWIWGQSKVSYYSRSHFLTTRSPLAHAYGCTMYAFFFSFLGKRSLWVFILFSPNDIWHWQEKTILAVKFILRCWSYFLIEFLIKKNKNTRQWIMHSAWDCVNQSFFFNYIIKCWILGWANFYWGWILRYIPQILSGLDLQ